MQKLFIPLLVAVLTLLPFATDASGGTSRDQKLIRKLSWRSIGPFIGGRVVAIAGVPSDPNVFYFGGVEGGVWRSTDYGNEWTNISDGKLPGTAQTIGALAVAPSNPKLIYAGSGEGDIRNDVDTGDGVYKTLDAGKTWHYAGLRDTHTTTALIIDPKNPDIVYTASMGHVFKPNAERGIFKTTDGGKIWKRVLFVNADTGAANLVMDPTNPRVLYASMWQAQRLPWKLTSGGPGSGLYKTTDAGAHWTVISKNPGFAHEMLGHMGISVATTDSRVVYAIVQARDGGVFRSTNGGASWKRVNSQMKLRQRAFYYMSIYVDPTNAQTAYAPEVDDVFKTTDGGVTWKSLFSAAYHGDHHIIWINPHNPKIMLEGDDGGATVSTDGGSTWSSEDNQATGQYYHIALDQQFPFHVYGAAQDEGAFEGPSATATGAIALGDWHGVASGESTFVAPEPGNANVTYGAGYYSVMLRQDNSTGQAHNVSPWPTYLSGSPASAARYRFGWTHPILFSPTNDHELLNAAQNVFVSNDSGQSWKVISPDLTRNDKRTEGPSGGPIDFDQTGAETFPDISSLAVSPLDGNILWAGSADGLVHVTRDHGATWSLVTPPQLPQWANITSIEPSHTVAGTAFVTASRYMWDDFHPYIYVTTDYGAHWTSMTTGLPNDEYVFVVRQDPREPRLMLAGTRNTVYVSMNGGALWQSLALDLPGVQVRDIAIDMRQGEVAVATHGRAVWILDNLALLEHLTQDDSLGAGETRIFAPETAWLSHSYGSGPVSLPDVGKNPDYGASVFFNLPPGYKGKIPVALSFEDAHGGIVRSFTLHLKPKRGKKVAPETRYEMDAIHQRALDLAELTGVEPGINRFQWDLRYSPATEIIGFKEPTTDDFSAAVDGPTIVPGTYTVVLRYGTLKMTQPLVVQLDPRLHPGPDELDARLTLEMRVHDALEKLDSTVNAAIAVSSMLAPEKRSELEHAVAALAGRDVHSSEGDVLHETKVREHLAFLANELEGAYEKPTPAEYATFADYAAEATNGEARLHALLGFSRPANGADNGGGSAVNRRP